MLGYVCSALAANRAEINQSYYDPAHMLTLEDMPSKLHLRLRVSDIREGVATDCEECPFARATLRELEKLGFKPLSLSVGPGHTAVQVVKDGRYGYFTYENSGAIGEWIYSFDHTIGDASFEMKPIKGTLTLDADKVHVQVSAVATS